jgi:hypothetical protein
MPDRQDTLEYHARLFRVAMPIEKYHRLPQNPDYKVEYANHEAIFEYRPRMRMARQREARLYDGRACTGESSTTVE